MKSSGEKRWNELFPIRFFEALPLQMEDVLLALWQGQSRVTALWSRGWSVLRRNTSLTTNE